MKIRQTNKYDIFKVVDGNRKLNPTHLKNLAESILKNNMLAQNPIIINDDFEVIDGQHRLEVAKINNLTIYFMTVDDADLQEVQLLNANLKSWSMNDYLDSYITLGNNEYLRLKDFSQKYGVSISMSMLLLTNNLAKSSISTSGLIRDFKSGEFKITHAWGAMKTAEAINLIKPYCEGTVWKDVKFVASLVKVLKKLPLTQLLNKAKNSTGKLQRKSSIRDYLLQFEDLVNFRAKNKVRLY